VEGRHGRLPSTSFAGLEPGFTHTSTGIPAVTSEQLNFNEENER